MKFEAQTWCMYPAPIFILFIGGGQEGSVMSVVCRKKGARRPLEIPRVVYLYTPVECKFKVSNRVLLMGTSMQNISLTKTPSNFGMIQRRISSENATWWIAPPHKDHLLYFPSCREDSSSFFCLSYACSTSFAGTIECEFSNNPPKPSSYRKNTCKSQRNTVVLGLLKTLLVVRPKSQTGRTKYRKVR